MLNEVWKDIPHYEGLYQISNFGRVKALARRRENHTHGVWIQPEQIMSVRLNKDGYECVCLTPKNGKRKTERVHRLVALAFIPNPDKKPEVNHINCIRDDNRVKNLEWVTRQENIAHTVKCGGRVKKYIKCIETNQIFKTSKEASNINGGDAGNIRKVARNRKGSVKGFPLHLYRKNVALGIQTINE